MVARKLRILHISDLHSAGPRDIVWRRQRVLGDAWTRNLDELLKDGAFDLVCFTGDVANWGKAEEYARASEFLGAMLKHLELPVDRLFVVPGNHDIDRSVEKAAWRALRDKYDRVEAEALAAWMAGGKPPLGFKKGQREKLISRQAAYREWVGKTLGRPELLPEKSAHGTLGYRSTLRLPGHSFDVHIIGLDSAWAAGDNNDAGKLLLTDGQVGALTTGVDGKALPGFRLALVHHPLTDLHDVSHVRVLLAENVDLLLRGHLHEPAVETLVDPDRTSRQLAAGCIYGSDRWPNSCHAIEVHLDEGGRPSRYELRFRSWSDRGHWFDDGGVYRDARGGRLSWLLTPTPTLQSHPAQSPRAGVFVGREEELQLIASSVLPEDRKPVALCALQGMPGVGKTYLAEHFFTENQQRFPGGLRRLIIDPRVPQPADILLGQLADQLELASEKIELVERLREHLLQPLALLLVENVDSEPAARVAVELVRKLHGCPLILTGRFRGLGTSVGWTVVDVPPLLENQALQQLEQEWRPPRLNEIKERKDLAHELGYLPLALHLAASYLRYGGHNVASFLAELRARKLKLGPRDPADPLWATAHDPARAVLASTIELSLELLREQLGVDAERMLSGLAALGHASSTGFGVSLGAAVSGLSESEFRRLIHYALEMSVIAPVPSTERPEGAWRIHPLVAELLRGRPGASGGPNRMTVWFLARLPELQPGQGEDQGHNWKEVQQELDSLIDWLQHVSVADIARVERAGSVYAQRNGPYAAWLSVCERALAHSLNIGERSNVLWTLTNVALRGGAPVRALQAAGEKAQIDREQGNEYGLAISNGTRAEILQARGERDEALRILREEVLPVFEKLGDVHSRAVTQSKIANILQTQGELDETLRILREEVLPVFEKLGDVRSHAVAQGKITDILQVRGEVDETLRILNEEVLPVFEKFGDVRSRAVVQGKIADILHARGEWDEALRILREEVLPICEKLGDVRSRAGAQSQVAGILQARGDLDEALRIRREEVLPIYEKLGDVRSCAVTQGQIADLLQERGELDEALCILREDVLPIFEHLGDVHSRAVAQGQVADILQARGELDEALRIRREEELPIYEKLGDVRSRAVTERQIADILQARGELDEALRIRREVELPIYEKLGDVRSRAITQSQIADILRARGELDEALRILREDVLPIFEQLGDAHSRAVAQGRIVDILQARGELDEALRILREDVLPIFEQLGDAHSRAVAQGRVVNILQVRGELDEAQRVFREEVLPILKKLGDI